mgnify:CR=1 FL=1
MAFLQIDYKSEALMRSVNIKVILPTDGLSGKWEPPYKTLYLLPGYSVNATELITYLIHKVIMTYAIYHIAR